MNALTEYELDVIGQIAAGGRTYQVAVSRTGERTALMAWILRSDGVEAARVIGMVRGELAITNKQARLAWPDDRDAVVIDLVLQIWDEAGLPRRKGRST